MLIDAHVRPALFEPICRDKSRLDSRCDAMHYHKMNPTGMDLLKKQYNLAGITGVFLLPSDCSFETGSTEISNDEIAKIVALDPDLYYGFASVDPRDRNSAAELIRSFKDLGLCGLYLNTSRLHIYPEDARIFAMLDICREYGKPVIFHAGLSFEKDALAKFSRPIEFESVIAKYSDINFCLTHMGWPWVQETSALLLKYPNAYANTALMNFDGPYQIYRKVFREDMGELWVEHNLSEKIIFGSGSPRIRPVRSKRGLDSLGFSEETRKKIYYGNAMRFLGSKEN